MKRILITSTDVMMYQFLLPHIRKLSENGYVVDVGCSHAKGYEDEGYFTYIKEHLPNDSQFYPLSLERNPYSLKSAKGLRELEEIIGCKKYDLIWTNEPVMSVITRLAARKSRKKGTCVLYLAHGYHFYKGAPRKNWVAYPIEKVMSHYCDAMCMINWEDYAFTEKHMPKKDVYHIDGIGFDSEKFISTETDRKKKRAELGISDEDIFILSVGELQSRKNHEPVIRAIGQINDKRIKYVICGWGELKDHLLNVAKEVGIADRFILTGHRYDIPEILKCADIFVHPSKREGLGIAALEAMAAGLPMITSNIQGIKDYITDGVTGFSCDPDDIDAYKKAIETLIRDENLRKQMISNSKETIKKYDIESSVEQTLAIIEKLCPNKEEA